MLADSKYHVKINGVGLTLLEESYRKKSQQPFNPRFSTGDYGMGDLSFWQFLAQEKWTTQEQELFYDKTMYRQSAGFNIRSGRPYLANGPANLSLLNPLPAAATPGGTNFFEAFDSGFAGDWVPINAYSWVTGTALSRTAGAMAAPFANGLSEGMKRACLTSIGTFEWDMAVLDGALNATLLIARFMYVDGNNFYSLEVSGIGMTTWTLKKMVAGVSTTLGTYTATSKVNTFTHCKITRDGSNNLTVYQDGVQLGTAVDASISSSAWFQFETYNTSANNAFASAKFIFDSVAVTDSSGTGAAAAGAEASALIYDNQIYTSYVTAAAAFTATHVVARDTSQNIADIWHLAVDDIALVNRDGAIGSKTTFLAAVSGQTLKFYDSNQTVVKTVTLTIYGTCIIPISSTVVLVAGAAGNRNGKPAFERVTFSANSWTVSAQVPYYTDGGPQGAVCGSYAFDSSGTLYLAYTDMTAVLGQMPSRIYTMTAADIVAANPTITQILPLPGFRVRGLFSLGGVVYAHGAAIEAGNAYSAVIKLSGGIIHRSTKARSLTTLVAATAYNYGIQCTFRGQNSVLFLSENDLGLWDPVLELGSDGNIREVAAFNSKALSYGQPTPVSIAEFGGAFYLIRPGDGVIQKTGASAGGFPNDYSYCVLQLSDMGGNTPLILKSLYSVIVELSQALPSGQILTAIVNGITVGTMTSTDGTYKEINVPVNTPVVANTFTPKLQLLAAQGFYGYLKRAALKFIPVQLKKRAWGFGIRATNNLKLVDGKRDHRFAKSIFSQLETAWASNTPITFVDVDGASYSVIITEFDLRRPLISEKGDWHKEGFYFVELLEV